MQNVPKIVRERLRAAVPVQRHPDANVLTAFAEKSLPELDRAIVLEHLAVCGDCREILALSLPATEMVEVKTVPARTGWLTWPALRWGFVAAGIVAIASLGVVQYQRRAQSTAASKIEAYLKTDATMARNEQPAAAAAPAPAQTVADKAAEKKGQFQDERRAGNSVGTVTAGASGDTNESKLMARAEPAPATPALSGTGATAGALSRQLPHGPKMPEQWQQQQRLKSSQAAPASLPATPTKQETANLNQVPPSVSETVEVESAAVQAHSQTQETESSEEGRISRDDSASKVGKAKPAEAPSTAIGGLVNSPSRMTSSATAKLDAIRSASTPRWNISPSGALLRSFDQGNSWQPVDVNASSAPTYGSTSLEIVAKNSRAKAIKEKDADQKTVSGKALAFFFRAVTATGAGADVWAGGTGGALFHSSDAGDHWTRVIPTSNGMALSGDITTVEFVDSQHGTVTTSTPEIWTTADAGQSWQKQ